MKHLKIFAAVCCVAAVFAACEKNDVGSASGISKGHKWVDLELPSGLKWATCNVGASSPKGYGDYFAWGETASKQIYSWKTYKWAATTYDAANNEWDLETITKYQSATYDYDPNYNFADNKTVLDPEDDAARAAWGGSWRLPTVEEWEELRSNCTWTWTKRNNVNGYEVKGPNGNSIFLPAAGYRENGDFYGANDYGCYWSSSLVADYYYSSTSAYCMEFESYDVNEDGNTSRDLGCSVRPVCD